VNLIVLVPAGSADRPPEGAVRGTLQGAVGTSFDVRETKRGLKRGTFCFPCLVPVGFLALIPVPACELRLWVNFAMFTVIRLRNSLRERISET